MSLRALYAALFFAAGISGAPAFADELTGNDIIRLTPGTFQAVVKGKYKVTVTLTRDGTAVGTAKGVEDRGRWTVRGNQLCIVMPTWTLGRIECSSVVADSGWYRGRNVAFKRL
jgi:hypothetical protein